MIEYKNRLNIFIKNPEKGKVKTRLAKTVGDDMALEVYQYLLKKTMDATLDLNCDRTVYYSRFVDEKDEWDNSLFQKRLQSDGELGLKMKNAFKEAFDNGSQKVLIIGSDCPQISADLINMAFDLLDNTDCVLGPAKDGGYYLLGMKTLLTPLFENKEWSTDSVLDDTVLDLLDAGLKYAKLPMLSDVDDAYDLHLLKDRFK